MLCFANMKYKGLADPKDKPFGRVLPFEVQVKIMFWVECFYTMDKRKKLLREFKGLPKCDVTGLPQHLGEDQWWNQLVFCLHTPRTSHCHHCHRLFDHKLSVIESGYDMFFCSWLNTKRRSCIFYADWYDGGNGWQPRQLRQPHERGDGFRHSSLQRRNTQLSPWTAPSHDREKEAFCL